MRVNLKELIEELEKIRMFGIHRTKPIDNNSNCDYFTTVEIPEVKLDNVIMKLKQLENIYNQ